MEDTLTADSGTLATVWKDYNGESSFLPFYLPLILWISTYVYSRKQGFDFSKWYTVHNLHNGGAIFLGLVSIYNDNDAVFNERIPILWSVGYFAVDIFDCTLRGDWIYLLHGAFCFGLGLANYTTPLCRQMRMNSKATLCETSNPFMHLAKKTRNPLHFALFALVFTICRILWLPFMMWQVHQAGMTWTDWRLLGVGAFFGLNFYWYIKIWKILLDGLRGEKVSKAE